MTADASARAWASMYCLDEDALVGVRRLERRPLHSSGPAQFLHAGSSSLQRTVDAGNGAAESISRFVRGPAEHVAQDQHGARSRRKVLDGGEERKFDGLLRNHELIGFVDPGEELIGDRLEPGNLVEPRGPVWVWSHIDDLDPALLGFDGVETCVRGNPVEPGSEAGAALEGVATTPGPAKRLLHQILCIVEVSEHPVAVHSQLLAMRLGKRGKRPLVTALNGSDDRFVLAEVTGVLTVRHGRHLLRLLANLERDGPGRPLRPHARAVLRTTGDSSLRGRQTNEACPAPSPAGVGDGDGDGHHSFMARSEAEQRDTGGHCDRHQ
jgi:hypothetical protein